MTYHHPYNRGIIVDQEQENARILWGILQSMGWTLEAACGALGNWESECNLNTNDPQFASGFPTSETSRDGGFGLAQWTACGDKILWYAQQQGVAVTPTDDNPAADPRFQLTYHEWECVNGLQGTGRKTWYEYNQYYLPWADYKRSTKSPEDLAVIYYWSYERSGAMDPGSRPAQARKWYDYLSAVGPVPVAGEKGRFLILAYGAGLIK